MKKIFLGIIFNCLILGLLTGCTEKVTISTENDVNNNKENEAIIDTKGKCSAIECIKQISVENTVEEINSIIGFSGKLIDEKYNKYYWELSEDYGIEVTYSSRGKGTIKVDADRNMFANKNVDFSKYAELESKIKDGISYEDFISYIGKVDGVLIEKSSIVNKYVWVSENGSYLNASFSNSSGLCTFSSGMIK